MVIKLHVNPTSNKDYPIRIELEIRDTGDITYIELTSERALMVAQAILKIMENRNG